MDGTGYPKRLKREDMSLPARMMAIADIFEALTAADRPYKKAKSLSEALGIMATMCREAHIDADLFGLFINEGVYMAYATRFSIRNKSMPWIRPACCTRLASRRDQQSVRRRKIAAKCSIPAWSSTPKRASFGLSRSRTPIRRPSLTNGTTSSLFEALSQAI